MTDDQSENPQSDTERLKAEIAHKEREIEELKREFSRTKKVEDDLWSHDIYLTARKKLVAGVIVVVGVLSALGLVTIYQLF
jgi:predicted RNase H-like nuclease (RuvC/YqgF family)